MIRSKNACIMHALVGALVVGTWGCSGDDVTYAPEAGQPKSDATVDAPASPDAGDATVPQRLLMTQIATKGELVAFNTQTKQVDGRLSFPGFGVVVRSGGTYLLETGQDIVARLDPSQPWKVQSTWSVAMDDAFDGGESYADPIQIVQVSSSKAYVLRYNRNRIAVVDPSANADAGAPSSSVDLSSLMQAGDGDGHVDMSGAVYDASRQRLYVALANIDIHLVDPQGYFLLCAGTKSTLIAIDTTNDTLVNLGGTGPGGGVELAGYSPQMGFLGGVLLDAASDRVLVLSTGCNQPTTDGGTGALVGRLVEAVDLKANTTQVLLDASAQDFPGQIFYLDGTHAIAQFGYGPFATTFRWDPTQPSLGTAFATAPDLFDLDLAGNRMLGPETTFASDGGAGPMNVIGVDLGDGGVTVLGQNPFLESGGFLGNALLSQ
ncbi:MAG TPA: hypothetical protein VLM85_26520 [Polyangiaceae bacterium]|nr:hypothetical protein [Polyangiaceae bacterium]